MNRNTVSTKNKIRGVFMIAVCFAVTTSFVHAETSGLTPEQECAVRPLLLTFPSYDYTAEWKLTPGTKNVSVGTFTFTATCAQDMYGYMLGAKIIDSRGRWNLVTMPGMPHVLDSMRLAEITSGTPRNIGDVLSAPSDRFTYGIFYQDTPIHFDAGQTRTFELFIDIANDAPVGARATFVGNIAYGKYAPYQYSPTPAESPFSKIHIPYENTVVTEGVVLPRSTSVITIIAPKKEASPMVSTPTVSNDASDQTLHTSAVAQPSPEKSSGSSTIVNEKNDMQSAKIQEGPQKEVSGIRKLLRRIGSFFSRLF